MNELQTSKPTQKLENYIFVKDIISVEGDIDMWGEIAPLTLTIPNYNKSMVLCLLKDNLVKDETWRYLNQEERIKMEIIQTGKLSPPHYKPNYYFRYKMPDTEKIITICCGEYFLIDYYDIKHFKRDIKELKKVVIELKEIKNDNKHANME